MSRHNGLHKTGPGPSIWHGHVQGCRGLRQRRSGPFKVSSRAALFSMHLKSGQYSHLTAICASRHYFFSFGRIAYVLSIHFLAPVSLASNERRIACGGWWRGFEKKEISRVCIYQNRMQHPEWMEYPVLCPGDGGSGSHLHTSQYVKTVHRCLVPHCRTAALCTQIFLLPTNVSTNMMTEEERGGEILHYCCGDASIITGT